MEPNPRVNRDSESPSRAHAAPRVADGGARSAQPDAVQLISDAKRAIVCARELVTRAGTNRGLSVAAVRASQGTRVWSERLRADTTGVREDVLAAVRALAKHQRAAGIPPEEIVILLKDIVASAKVSPLERDLARSLEADVVSWGIEAYYAAD